MKNKQKSNPIQAKIDELVQERMACLKEKIFTTQFSNFINFSAASNDKLNISDDDYLKLVDSIGSVLEGRRLSDVVLALTYHITTVMCDNELEDTLNKINEIIKKDDNIYIQ